MSLNGPPMAAICCATGVDRRPVTIMTTPKQSISPARNAAVIRRTRVLRVVMSDPSAHRERSQAGGDPCDDHLVEHRRGQVGGPYAYQIGPIAAVDNSPRADRQQLACMRDGHRLTSG